DQRGLGTAELAPATGFRHHVPMSDDAPEEVVRGEEDQVSAAVSVRADDVVLAGGHVFLVAREDDEPVRGAQAGAGSDGTEVRVGEVVGAKVICLDPFQEGEVVALPMRRRSSMEEGATEPGRALVPAGVPRVAVTVAVRVAEVVGLPGLSRDDDGDLVDAQGS